MEYISIIGLNIDGLSSKLEDLSFISFISTFDIVSLSELKCNYPFSIAGYKCIRSSSIPGEDLRGGVAILVKNSIWKHVNNVCKYKDQVWFNLSCIKYARFGAVYIAPSDSPYFSLESFAVIQEECKSYPEKCVVIGDINSRIPDLSEFIRSHLAITYSNNPDKGSNSNGRNMKNIMLSNDLLPVNNMSYMDKVFSGALTFRKGTTWVSQIDWVLCHSSIVPHIDKFEVISHPSFRSAHAAVAVYLKADKCCYESLHSRAHALGQSVIPNPPSKPSIKLSSIDTKQFSDNLPDPQSFWNCSFDSPGDISQYIVDSMYVAASSAKIKQPLPTADSSTTSLARWKKLLTIKDSKQLWKSIDWNGSFETPPDCLDRPSDDQFCEYFTELLNPPGGPVKLNIPDCVTYVPLLDDPIQPIEVEDVIKKLKPDKAAGIDGISPGLFKHMPDEWLLILTYLFNCVFTGEYPLAWAIARMFMIFKKGGRLDPANYRGISLINAITKLYDMVLNNRFTKWYKPRSEQAGAQKGRGCEEQILALRLLIDIARRTKRTLYIGFVDFIKAYDKILRSLLLVKLVNAGCGGAFMRAIAHTMTDSKCSIGSSVFTSSMGLRQGGATSCSLFTFYVDEAIQSLDMCGADNWLENLHCLMQMDDTAILATTRTSFVRKLRSTKDTCDDIGQTMHPIKSKYLAVNAEDTSPIILDDVVISHTTNYIYLGANISISTIPEQIANHMRDKSCHGFKFTSFLRKNSDAPFPVKEKVWNSALTSAIMYSCETWLTSDLRKAETLYISSLKQLLGVRTQTPNNMVLAELNVPSAAGYIIERQSKFLLKLLARPNYSQSYISRLITEARRLKSPMGKSLNLILSGYSVPDPATSIRLSSSSRRLAYIRLNPNLDKNKMYSDISCPEYARIAATRMRLSSHRLKFEMARWSRQPRDTCVCACSSGALQDELHVLLQCPLTKPLLSKYPSLAHANSLNVLFDDCCSSAVALYCYEVLRLLT